MGHDGSRLIHDMWGSMLGLHVLGWCVLGCLTIHVHLGGE